MTGRRARAAAASAAAGAMARETAQGLPQRAKSAMILTSSTHPGWFAKATSDLPALLSDHLHCERKAAENALSLVRRYPHRGGSVDSLGRLAHEETSHVVQVASLILERGWSPRADHPNRYARGLLGEVRGREPQRLVDSLLVAALIEARSHERLAMLAHGFALVATRDEQPSDAGLAAVYRALATAEERHAEIFLALAEPLVAPAELAARIAFLAARETEILASLPHGARVH